MERRKVADPILAPVEHDPWDPSTWNVPQGSSAPVHLMAGLGNALMQTWKGNVQGMVDPVKSLATLPGDVYTGKESLATPEGQRRVQEAALTMMGGGSAPKGAAASGLPWKQVLDHYNGLNGESGFGAKAQSIGEYMQGGQLSPSEAVEQAGKHLSPSVLGPLKAAAKVMEDHPLAPEKAQESFSGDALDHPAVTNLPSYHKGPANELLSMMKGWPDIYKNPHDALAMIKDDLEPHELSDFNVAAKMLQNYQDTHGKFNFAAPEKIQPAFLGPLNEHPAVHELTEPEKYGEPMVELLHMMKGNLESMSTPKAAADHLIKIGWVDKEEHSTYKKTAEILQEHIDEMGKLNFGENSPKEPAPKAAPPGWTSADTPDDPLSGLSHPLDRGRSSVKSPKEALYPVNWNDLTSTVKRPGETASGPYADTLRRAESLGYNTNLPLFKGLEDWQMPTGKNPEEGIWGPEADKMNAWSDPSTKPNERGIFASDTPEISNWYAGQSGQNFQMFANPKSTLAVHWPDVAGDPSFSGDTMKKVIEAARAKDAEALVIHGMQDVGGPQTQYVFMKNNVLRSIYAMFDPKKVESANLLHSGGSPLLIPVNHDPFKGQQ
jgi:hypothetical protein